MLSWDLLFGDEGSASSSSTMLCSSSSSSLYSSSSSFFLSISMLMRSVSLRAGPDSKAATIGASMEST